MLINAIVDYNKLGVNSCLGPKVEIITFSFAWLLQYSWVLKFPATFKTLFSIGPIVFSELDDSASCFGQSSLKQTIHFALYFKVLHGTKRKYSFFPWKCTRFSDRSTLSFWWCHFDDFFAYHTYYNICQVLRWLAWMWLLNCAFTIFNTSFAYEGKN